MTFTYLGTLGTDLDYIRFKVGDTVSGSGIKPSDANFTDEEINGLLTIEGSTDRTVAAIYETLSLVWAKYVDSEIGSRKEKSSQTSARYAALAKKTRDDYGFGASTISVATGSVTRRDGYSSNISSSEA